VTKPPVFIELCAGTAALSLRLQGGAGAKPPVSRMGAKTGYADAILAVLGLYPGQGAESYLWCEPDDGVRGLLMAYAQPDVLRAAAKILRGWKDEEPRALWERLRAELKAGAAVEGAEGVARYVVVKGNSVLNLGDGFGAQKKTGAGGIRCPHSVEDFALRITELPCLPPTFIARDGRAVTPEEVAGWCVLAANARLPGQPDSGWRDFAKAYANGDRGRAPNNDAIAACVAGLDSAQWPPVTITADARTISPLQLPEGVIVYADPPYSDTTGYKHDLPRDEVVKMARMWAAAGATVCISEAEPIPELMADGWHAVEISATRRGAKRTFSKQQAEWLTLSRPPSFVPRAPEVFIEAPIVEVVKPARAKAAPVEVVAAEPQEVRQVDLFGGDR